LTDAERLEAYGSDITYGTNNEFGFDYLRDNMKFDAESLVQKDLHYAIVDEVDSILIDEARTPLIISGPAEKSTHLYYDVNNIIPRLKKETTTPRTKRPRAWPSPKRAWPLPKAAQDRKPLRPGQHRVAAPRQPGPQGPHLFKRDVDYIVKEGQVIIVDEFTGRLMPGRRYSDGLHQALEAKENVRSKTKTRPWPPSPSRTTSACTTSCPA
jgi:preprotein translocase subunit SecA